MTKEEVEVVAVAMVRSYCPLSWPMAKSAAKNPGWLRSARTVIRALDKHRKKQFEAGKKVLKGGRG